MALKPAQHRKAILLLAASSLYAVIAYPLYRLAAPPLIRAMHEGRLGRALQFQGSAWLPVEHYLQLADRWFFSYLWLLPLASTVFWPLVFSLARRLWTGREPAMAPPPGPLPGQGPGWDAAAAAFYLLAALAFFWPILPRFASALIGTAGDNLKYIWTMWWGRQVLLDPAASLDFSPYLFYPEGG